MEKKINVSFLDLISSLSHAIDLISPTLHHHHKQVAYIAYHIGKELQLPLDRQYNLLIASLLHDIGALTIQDRIDALNFENNDIHDHAEVGYLLLKGFPKFLEIATIIRYHHLPWQDEKGGQINGETVPIESHIIHLADRVSVLIHKEEEIITQAGRIQEMIEKKYSQRFHPQLLKIFKAIKEKEYFWFDITSHYIDDRLEEIAWDNDENLDINELLEVVKIFARVIDFRSRFTAVHSSGVAAVAEALAGFLGWSEEARKKLKIAGYLHDLGKLAIPNRILDKNGKLTNEEFNRMKMHTYYSYYLLDGIEGLEEIKEYGALHHERLDGNGYPFHKKGEVLKEGSRIMAVADVFTAIKENRPYRKGMVDKDAMRVLKNMKENNMIDGTITDVLFENFGYINEIRKEAQEDSFKEYESFSKKLMVIKRRTYA